MLTPATFQKQWESLAIAAAAPLFLAISGGVDSVVLLDLLRHLKNSAHTITLLHVNYQLREEAETETAWLKKFAADHDLKLVVRYYPQDAPFNEERGRKFRYDFFAETLTTGALLLTAHHLDDLAETFLMKVTRGTRLEKLGFPAVRPFGKGQLGRPLLTFSKEEIYQYAKYHHLTYFEDSTNASLDYARNRYRHQLVPLLKKENPQFLTHVGTLNQQLLALKISTAAHAFEEELDLTEATSVQVAQWLAQNKISVPPRQLAQIISWSVNPAKNDDELVLSAGVLKKTAGVLSWKKKSSTIAVDSDTTISAQADFLLESNQWTVLNAHEKIGLFTPDVWPDIPPTGQLSFIPLYHAPTWPLVCRHAHPGDTIALKKTGYTKSVARYFIDQKIVKNLRPKVWLITDSLKNVLWIVPDGKSYLSTHAGTDKILYRLIYLKY